MAFDKQLRGVNSPPVLADAEMNVRRAAGVRHRFDGAEVIMAVGIGQEPAVALEVIVAMVATLIVRVQINAVVINLPDFYERISHRLARSVQIRPVRCVMSPTAGVSESLTMIKSLSVSSGILSG